MPTQDIQTQIRALEKKRFDCLIQKRFDEFSTMCDNNLRYVHTSGTVEDLTAFITNLRVGYYDYQSIDYDIVDIIDMKDCVIVIANLYAKLLVNNQPRTLQNRALSIWNKDNDQLKLMMYQSTAFGDE